MVGDGHIKNLNKFEIGSGNAEDSGAEFLAFTEFALRIFALAGECFGLDLYGNKIE